jgi:hypothetical protein
MSFSFMLGLYPSSAVLAKNDLTEGIVPTMLSIADREDTALLGSNRSAWVGPKTASWGGLAPAPACPLAGLAQCEKSIREKGPI